MKGAANQAKGKAKQPDKLPQKPTKPQQTARKVPKNQQKNSTSIGVDEVFNDVEEDLTSDGEAERKDDDSGNDIWVEVFLVAEK